jgi:anti-anti-sigma regulatory factor
VLRITIQETESGSRWILQGQLAGPWVDELRKYWKMEHRAKNWKSCVIDLNDVTHIDKAGERLLRALSKKGAEFVATGLYTKQLIEKVKATARLALRNMGLFLLATLLLAAIFGSDCQQTGTKQRNTGSAGRSVLGKSEAAR